MSPVINLPLRNTFNFIKPVAYQYYISILPASPDKKDAYRFKKTTTHGMVVLTNKF